MGLSVHIHVYVCVPCLRQVKEEPMDSDGSQLLLVQQRDEAIARAERVEDCCFLSKGMRLRGIMCIRHL